MNREQYIEYIDKMLANTDDLTVKYTYQFITGMLSAQAKEASKNKK